MPDPHEVLISTRNAHKTGEVRRILGDPFRVLDLSSAPDVADVEETGTTFEENATLKSVAASLVVEGWVIADDSGLEVDALNGGPGVYSARYAGPSASDDENNALLLENLEGVRGKNRSARFRCVIVLTRAGRKLAAFEGTVEGIIANAPTGTGGFGYDPLFIPDGHCSTFAKLPAEVKNQISHRAKALEKLKAWRGWF
ncbi:MAG: RdgB/HAM1 family non-canonical purine NTP pyrophosphatase [Terrimicrobiaceae bacterium]